MKYIISDKYNNKTVKDYIKNEIKLSSNMLSRLKRLDDGIMLNGKRVTVRERIFAQDTLWLSIEHETKESCNIVAVQMPLDIIFEDDYYIALNKPPYTPTHPSHNHYSDTLANGLAYMYKSKNLPFVFRAVNRLDKNTSGIVIFAKSAVAADRFSKLQQNKLVQKEYIALVNGKTDPRGMVEGYIRRAEESIITRVFSKTKDSDDAAYSLTEYDTLAVGGNCSLVHLLLHTGRTHQIRVHMSSIGHSILGDELYGQADRHGRHMLHALRISFIHPFEQKNIVLAAPVPDDFLTVMSEKGIKYEFKL